MSKPVRLFLVDDSPVFRAGLLCWVEAHPDLAVVGAAPTAEEAFAALAHTPTDVVVLDLDLPGMSGIEALQEFRRSRPGLRVVVLTLHDTTWARTQVAAAGADAFVSKSAVGEQLHDAILSCTSLSREEAV